MNKIKEIEAKKENTNLDLNIILELKRSNERLGISGSLIKFNQISDTKKDTDNPVNIKKLKNNGYENLFLWFFNLAKLQLIRIAEAGKAGSQ